MSVIVKGMRMPEKCGECRLFHAEYPMHCRAIDNHKTVGAPYGMPRPDWCPLTSLPEKHGDLIDRDSFDGRIRAAAGMVEEELSEDFKDGVLTILGILKKHRKVFEAEGEK